VDTSTEAATGNGVPRVLVVTNDFPPRVGGVQQYVWNLVRSLPAERVSVLAPNWPGWRDHDAAQRFPIHRWPARFLWPTAELGRRMRSLVREHQADVVLFGHGLPLPLLGEGLRERGVPYVALTHGAEVWLARPPGLAGLLSRALEGAREVTAVSDYTARTIRRVVPPAVPVTVLNPGVDAESFAPSVDGSWVRERHALGDRPVVLCVSRLVPRKGQDVLIRSLPLLQTRAPGAALVLAGGGPYREALERAAATSPSNSVVFAGEVSDDQLPAYYAACDVFAMPCRSRWGGLEVEGFGIVFLEAAASRKAAVGGHSGGAGEAVVDEQTGLLVQGAEPKAVALACAKLLRFPDLAASLGTAGRLRVENRFTWPRRAEVLSRILRRAAG
jgi:phosphatidylinositol alpha-1,6-mannosyltransferase